jgi:phosphoribosylaminoimidazole (AIR) synthetase
VGFLGALAQDIYYVHTKDAGVVPIPGEAIDSVKVEGDAIKFYAGNNLLYTNTLANVDSIRFIEPPVTQTAYPYGIPHLPGIVEAENFDKGGEGVAYHDNTENNTQGGAYRLSPEDQGVDIQAGGNYSNGFIVADIEAGEWLSYTINAPTTGKYGFAFWVMNDTGVTFDVLIDGNSIGQAAVPNTSWDLIQISGPAAVLSAGIHIVTFNFNGGFGFDKFSFKTSEAYPDGIPHAPGVVEGEDFDKGGEGIGYHDTDAWNADTGTDYRTDPEDSGVDLQKGGHYSNGYALVGIAPDEWTNYTINAPEDGTYAFSFWTLNDNSATFDLVIDGEQAGQVTVPNSSWGIVKVIGPDVLLSEGTHVVTLQFHGSFGLDKFEFIKKTLAYPDGVPHLPGVVEAEDFDMGGEGVSFHDEDGHDGPAYRTDPADAPVDFQAGDHYSNGFAVVRIAEGEWLNYTINVPTAGSYKFSFWTLSDSPSTIDLSIDNVFAAQVNLPNTSWAIVKTTGPNIELSAGTHVLTILFHGGPGFDKFSFNLGETLAYPDGIPHAPGIVEAEDFDIGGEGVSFHDEDGHDGPIYRTDPADAPVDLQAGDHYSNGFAVVRIVDGEWLNYTINVPTAGFYKFSFWTLSDSSSTIDLSIDNVFAEQANLPNTGWALVETAGPIIELSAGTHVVTILFHGAPGFDKFSFGNP